MQNGSCVLFCMAFHTFAHSDLFVNSVFEVATVTSSMVIATWL